MISPAAVDPTVTVLFLECAVHWLNLKEGIKIMQISTVQVGLATDSCDSVLESEAKTGVCLVTLSE